MYKVGDYIMHKRDVCIINSIRENFFGGKDYYSISPVDDKSLIINVPIDSPVIKDIITAEKAQEIINEIPNVEIIKNEEKNVENIYKELLDTDDFLDLVKIIKTTYLRNKIRVENGKKIGDKDDMYFKKVENLLYTSLAIPLNISRDECKEYIISRIKEKEEEFV